MKFFKLHTNKEYELIDIINPSLENIYNEIGNNCRVYEEVNAQLLNENEVFTSVKDKKYIYKLYTDEEGKLKENTINPIATLINGQYYCIVGDVLLTAYTIKDNEITLCGIPDEVIEDINKVIGMAKVLL